MLSLRADTAGAAAPVNVSAERVRAMGTMMTQWEKLAPRREFAASVAFLRKVMHTNADVRQCIQTDWMWSEDGLKCWHIVVGILSEPDIPKTVSLSLKYIAAAHDMASRIQSVFAQLASVAEIGRAHV